jgi:hypothetical protein
VQALYNRLSEKNSRILFAHENLAFRVGDLLWRARRKPLAVVVLQPRVCNAAIRNKVRALDAKFSCAKSIYAEAYISAYGCWAGIQINSTRIPLGS